MNCPKCREPILPGVTFCECGWREKGTGQPSNEEAYQRRRAEHERQMDERLKRYMKVWGR